MSGAPAPARSAAVAAAHEKSAQSPRNSAADRRIHRGTCCISPSPSVALSPTPPRRMALLGHPPHRRPCFDDKQHVGTDLLSTQTSRSEEVPGMHRRATDVVRIANALVDGGGIVIASGAQPTDAAGRAGLVAPLYIDAVGRLVGRAIRRLSRRSVG